MSDPTLSDIDFKTKWLGSELPLIFQPIRGRVFSILYAVIIWKLAVLASNIKRSESSVSTASTILFLERKASWESASYGATIHLIKVFTDLMTILANQSLWPIIASGFEDLRTRLRPLLRQSSLTALFIAGEIEIPFYGIIKNDQMVKYPPV